MKRLACVLALTGIISFGLVAPCSLQVANARTSSGLQLSIITPGNCNIGDKLSLDVSFRGSTVNTVELYMDNALLTRRSLDSALQRGIISFKLDTAMMTAGTHNVVVKAYGNDGKAVSASSQITLVSGDLSAPVRISYPQNGIQVSGVVPVRVHLGSDLQDAKPYVSIFVDKELKVLRNYPPYEYDWDTTKVANGWHLLEAWTQTDDSLQPTKATPIRIEVNNSGGQTTIQNSIPDLSLEMPNPAHTVKPSMAQVGAQAIQPIVTGPAPEVIPSNSIRPTASKNNTPLAPPTSTGIGTVTIPTNTTPINAASTPGIRSVLVQPRANGSELIPMEPVQSRMGTTTLPGSRTPRLEKTDGELLMPAIHPHSSNINSLGGSPSDVPYATQTLPKLSPEGTYAGTPLNSIPVEPKRMGGAISRPMGRMLIASVPVSALSANRKLAESLPHVNRNTAADNMAHSKNYVRISNWQKLLGAYRGAFQVAFDNDRIVFDVSPRIENGMGIAPFRQIFEHTGGRLYWYGNAKTVRAVNDTREIILKIGHANADVNNETVPMAKAPFIVRGRTMVPLTFIRDALNVNIQFDPSTGRLLIQSKN